MKTSIIVILAVTVLLLGCSSPPGPVIVPNKTIENTTGELNTSGIIIDSPKGCEEIDDPQQRDNCYMSRITTDPMLGISLCYKIENSRIQDRCIYVLSTENITYCPKISQGSIDLRDDCFYLHASDTNDKLLCSDITDKTLMKKCIREISVRECGLLGEYDSAVCLVLANNDPSYCADINGSQECYLEVAKKLPDVSACGFIENKVDEMACMGIVSGDYGACMAFDYNTTQDSCYEKIAVDLNDYSICGTLLSTETYINSCYQTLAVVNNKPALCTNLKTEPQRDLCYYLVGKGNNDYRVCNSIIETGRRDLCRIDVAKGLVDPSVCSNVENNYIRNYQCYSNIISGKGYTIDIESCGRIPKEDMDWKDECFLRIFRETQDSTICGYIQQESIRSRCG
ncbi:MAG: hypothetical protein ABIG39_05545 [Candidatus Micrarchaeota archaeon]